MVQKFSTTDGSLTLTSERYAESYRSRHGALSEARHVFLEASGVGDRLRALKPTAVLEVGFGTGLNFLLTAATAIDAAAGAATEAPITTELLRYTALENDPPPLTDVAALDYAALLAPSSLPKELLAWLRTLADPPAPGRYSLALGATQGATSQRAASEKAYAQPKLGGPTLVELELLIGDARDQLGGGSFRSESHDEDHDANHEANHYANHYASYDAVYLDPFSPKVNPALWTPEFLAAAAQALRPGGRLVTYSVSGAVRRALIGAGLEVTKLPGPSGGKREMLCATRPEVTAAST